MNPYESEKLLSEYLVLHYGGEEEVLGGLPGPREAVNFPARCVGELLDAGRLGAGASAIDVGCAVGRSSFELARHCDAVLGIDFSHHFIEAAQRLQQSGRIESARPVEGRITESFTATVPSGIERSRVTFGWGDAMSISTSEQARDVVLAANLICRLPEPMKFLSRLPSLVKPGGQLLLTTPFTWLEEFTPRERWLGAKDATDRRSIDVLKEILDPHFVLQAKADMPFLIREHARKFQYGVAQGSRWIRRG